MLIPFDPIIYKAVADRIGLIPHPQGVVGFYMRMVEIQQAVQVISVEVPGDAPVSAENAETLAGSLIVAGQLARSVISHGPSFGPDASLDEQVSQITLAKIDAAVESARRAFPNLSRQGAEETSPGEKS